MDYWVQELQNKVDRTWRRLADHGVSGEKGKRGHKKPESAKSTSGSKPVDVLIPKKDPHVSEVGHQRMFSKWPKISLLLQGPARCCMAVAANKPTPRYLLVKISHRMVIKDVTEERCGGKSRGSKADEGINVLNLVPLLLLCFGLKGTCAVRLFSGDVDLFREVSSLHLSFRTASTGHVRGERPPFRLEPQ